MEIDLHITNKCNLRCSHCIYSSGEWAMPDMTLNTVKAIMPAFKKMGVKEVHITGGEPFLNPELFDISKYLSNNDISVRVQTNGILITQEIVKKIKDCGIEYVLVSIDGLEKKHNSFRNCNYSFSSAINAVNLCLNAGLYTRVNTVLHKNNIDEIDELISFISTLNPSQHSFFYFTPVGRGAGIKDLVIELDNWKKIEQYILNTVQEIGCKYAVQVQNVLYNVASNNPKGCRDNNCLILSNGDVYHCVFFIYSPFKLGNIYTNDLFDIWETGFKNIVEKKLKRNENDMVCDNSLSKNRKCICYCPGLPLVLTGKPEGCDPRCKVDNGYIPGCIRTYSRFN